VLLFVKPKGELAWYLSLNSTRGIFMSKKIVVAVVSLMAVLSMNLVMAAAEPVKVATSFSYSKDSDGVVYHAYHIGTADEDKPVSINLYRTNIFQSGERINDNTILGKWQLAVTDLAKFTLWTGYTYNDIRTFIPYAVMYDTKLANDDHVWLSFGHNAVSTIQAYRQGVTSNAAGVSYLHDFGAGVNFTAQAGSTLFSDSNSEKKFNLAVSKKYSQYFTMNLGYGYDNAEHKASPVYYVPVGEQVLFVGANYTVPVGVGKLALAAEQSLAAHNSDGSIKRQSISADLTFGSFSTGAKYFRSGDYWAKTCQITWNHAW